MTFQPPTDHNDARAITLLEVRTNDEGRFGPPPVTTPPEEDVDYITVSITPLNDPPSLVLPGTQTANEELSTLVTVPVPAEA